MTATASRPAIPSTGIGLAQLAAYASRDLSADVVITSQTPKGTLAVAASAGIDRGEANGLLPSLNALASRSNLPTVVSVSMASANDRALQSLCRHGYASCATLQIGTAREPVGALHVMSREPIGLENSLLLRAYASHAEIAIAASKPHRSRHRMGRSHTIEALDNLALSATSFQDLISALDETLATLFGPLRCGIALWDHPRGVLYFVPGSFRVEEHVAVSCQVTMTTKHSNAARVFATGDPYLSNEAAGDPAVLREYVTAFGLSRLIAVRLETQGRPIGVLYVADIERDFRVADIWQLESLIPRISAAVECARAFFLLRSRHQLERILSDIAVAIARGQSMEDFLTPALGRFGEALDAAMVAIVPTDTRPMTWRSERAYPSWEQELLLDAARQPARPRARVRPPVGAGDPGSTTLQIPVKFGAQRVATLAVLRLRAQPFTDDERDALTRLARLAALARAMDTYQQERAELARAAERQRIADDLHDEVAQILFGAQMSLDSTLELSGLDERAAANVARARALLGKSDEVLRGIIGQLSHAPPSDLVTALASTVSEIEHEYGLPIHLDISHRARAATINLHRPAAKAMLRAAREALINAAKHAGPCRAIVRLGINHDRLRLSVADDGIGIENRQETGHYGLESVRMLIRDQGGTMRVSRGASGGTTLVVSFRL